MSDEKRNRPVVDFHKPGEAYKWITDLRDNVRDIEAVADDATRPPGDRGLGRRAAREMYEESSRVVEQLFDAALRGLLS